MQSKSGVTPVRQRLDWINTRPFGIGFFLRAAILRRRGGPARRLFDAGFDRRARVWLACLQEGLLKLLLVLVAFGGGLTWASAVLEW